MKPEYNILYNDIRRYIPVNEQEIKDKDIILKLMVNNDNLFVRDEIFHFTSSAWIVNKQMTKVLFVFHNIYNSWSWVGGHADNNCDLYAVAKKEAMEETGIDIIDDINKDIISLEILPVSGHQKLGEYISSHIHFNLTYFFLADELSEVRNKADENSDVMWIPIDRINEYSNEDWMKRNIYSKLINKCREV